MNIIYVDGSESLARDLDTGTAQQQATVREIISEVQQKGDEALFRYTEQLDGAKLDHIKVTTEEMQAAYEHVSEAELAAIRKASANIRRFHERQVQQSWMTTEEDGTMLGQKITPLHAAGVYVPGGKAAYPSTIMMNVIPAQVAGVKRIVMVSPPAADGTLAPGVLVTASELGVETVLKAGGAQAVAALAYGTETVPAVDKITGPGNIYVALAKREVFGKVDIDMIAGPSEVVVLADDRARPDYIAADMLSQAEHDEMASAILVTPSEALAQLVSTEVNRQLERLPRQEIAQASITDYGAIYVTETMAQAVDTVNQLAPEHLEVQTLAPEELLGRLQHAGAIFLGEHSSEPVGDYIAGPNHVLPTNGTARFSSPLNVEDFTKKSSVIRYTKEAIHRDGPDIAALARMEGLEAHARAVELRTKGDAGEDADEND
ncbi:histidinol dehydrogenase [Salsuginibacillus halophilus]|uniref:Histidinol dehydrogenase n=1 Tax=Salsuginibacillus halophilus TaxID=517424 RepID=A0A2P8H992_9BACI|nr:histidinol dehydrogenase [Salsuginibacillus halophilus]PSL42761.1 histidinol dehydrogenase [Salsuginibacillus halophilus]